MTRNSLISIIVLFMALVAGTLVFLNNERDNALFGREMSEERGLYIQENELQFISEMEMWFYKRSTPLSKRKEILLLCSQMKSQRSLKILLDGCKDADMEIREMSKDILRWRNENSLPE